MTLLYSGLAWLGGVALAEWLAQPMLLWLLVGGLAALAAVLLRTRPQARIALGLLAVAALGAARTQSAQPAWGDPAFISHYNGAGPVHVTGIVLAAPLERDQTVLLRVRADSLRPTGSVQAFGVHGLALMRAPRYPQPQVGDRLQASGWLDAPAPFADFDYAALMARRGVYSALTGIRSLAVLKPAALVVCPANVPGAGAITCGGLWWQRRLQAVRASSLAVIARDFPQPHAALLSGILLGVDSGLPRTLQADFRTTGTAHIIAISGFNISVIAAILMSGLGSVLGQRRARPLALLGIAAYTVLAGADASVVRAALMGALVIVAQGLGRPAQALTALIFAAVAMTAWEPRTLWDVGFQLSVGATLSLLLYSRPLQSAVTALAQRWAGPTGVRIASVLGEFTVLTAAAQVLTLPLTAYYFRQLSVVGLLANLIVLPAQPAVMVLGGLATVAGLISPALGQMLAWVVWPFLAYTIQCVQLLARVPFAALPLDSFPLLALLGCYTVIFGATWFARSPVPAAAEWLRQHTLRLQDGALVVLALATVLAWSMYARLPDGRLHVTFLDVGAGDAVLITTPGGARVLLNGGPSPRRLAAALGEQLPFTHRTLQLVVTAGSGAGSVNGLPGLLERFTIERTLQAAEPSEEAGYREWSEGIARRGIPQDRAQPNTEYDLGDGVRLRLLAVGAQRTLLELRHGSASFLFGPDLTGKSSGQLAAEGLVPPANVLQVAQQGGVDVLSLLFMLRANPWAAVIPVGAGNPDGAPGAATLQMLAGRAVLRTDRNGWVDFATDGRQLWVWTER